MASNIATSTMTQEQMQGIIIRHIGRETCTNAAATTLTVPGIIKSYGINIEIAASTKGTGLVSVPDPAAGTIAVSAEGATGTTTFNYWIDYTSALVSYT